VLFKNDQIYSHNIIQINYTTYDIRQAQDVKVPGSIPGLVNIQFYHLMLLTLSLDFNMPLAHPFCYAQVLGIYHANVIHIDPGVENYQPKQMEFLWVRWYELPSQSYTPNQLATLQFIPMADEDIFGFIDPADILQACHLIPVFAKGKLHPDGIRMSRHAHDAQDWKVYYINRHVSNYTFQILLLIRSQVC
ncbi:hypothetical protein SERLA73DRAFT_45179, partial [Serpula lacrymans var. lacrymans S7.3]